MWSATFICMFMLLSVNAYSKYGRSCKDIGCLNSEVCVMAEDPCSYGRTSDCGTYPTCKKKTAADGETHNVPAAKPTTPKPIADLKPQPPPSRFDDIPNYPPPPPPRQPPSYGGGSNGYGGGGSNGYGGGGYSGGGGYNGGGGYGGGGYGGGGSPGYGSGGSPGYGGGGSNGYGGGSSSGGFGGGSQGGGSGLTDIFKNFGFGGAGGAGGTGGQSGSGSNPITNILSNFLTNFTKNGFPSLNPSFTRPGLIENHNVNPNLPANSYGYYPSYNQPSNTQAQANGQSHNRNTAGNSYSSRNYATTRKPVSYGWNIGISIMALLFMKVVI